MAPTPTDLITLDPVSPWDAATLADPASFFAATHFPVTPGATGADPTSPSNALQAAYDALSASGPGTIRIWPGSDRYVFDKPVVLGRRPVRIVQAEGALIAQADGASHVFEVATRLTYDGLDARYDVASSGADRSLFRFVTGVEQASAVNANASKFVRRTGSGSWIEDGYQIGDYIEALGYQNAGNNGYWLVIGPVSDLSLPVRSLGGTLVNENALSGRVRRLYQFAGSRIRGGRVSLAPASTDIPGYYVFRAEGLDGNRLVHGLAIEGVTFEIRNVTLSGGSPAQQTQAWTGAPYTSTPRGLGFFKGRFLRAAQVTRCWYLPNGTHDFTAPPSHATGATQHYGGVLIDYESSHECIFSDLVVAGVSLAASSGHSALPLILIRSSAGVEGGHCQIRGLESENVVAAHAVYLEDCPWVKLRDIHIGRWFPGKTTAAFRIVGGRANDVIDCGTHNVNGPVNAGSFSIAGGVATGTGIGLGIADGDYVELSGFSEDADGVWQVTSAGDDEIGFDPDNAPVDAPGDGDEKVRMQSWVTHYSDSRDAQVKGGSHVYRKSAAPPHRFDNCVGMMVDPIEPTDSPYTYR